MKEKTIIIDIKGKFAYFRKYFTNSSSLSYYFPPRTVICGILGAICGFKSDLYCDYEEKNDYNKIFHPDNIKIALSIKTKLRIIKQTINNIKITEFPKYPVKFYLKSKYEHTQVPIELVLSDGNEICYRLYLGIIKESDNINSFLRKIKSSKSIFPIYFGKSEFTAYYDFISNKVENKKFNKSNKVNIHSIINSQYVERYNINGDNEILIEKMPNYFDREGKREIQRVDNFLFDRNLKPILCKLNIPYYSVKYINKENEEVEENIVFYNYEVINE